jgi:putative ABC transport system substrate-binding protein
MTPIWSRRGTPMTPEIPMRRVRFIAPAILALAFLAAPLTAEAQTARTVPRIGYLSLSSSAPFRDAFVQGLRDLGYIEGQSILVEYRSAGGRPERLAEVATDLARLNPNILVTGGTAATAAARTATTSTPIVAVTGDPVGSGFAASLAHPGGRITGLALLSADMSTKWIELVSEIVPRAARVAVLVEPEAGRNQLPAIEPAARRLGLQLLLLEIRRPDNFDRAFDDAVRKRVDAIVPLSSPVFANLRLRIIELAARHRLPAVYEDRLFTEAGGLLSYGPSIAATYRRAASYVDRILRGARPADLPIEQPTKFELLINLKTAKALALTIPPSVLARADEVIE